MRIVHQHDVVARIMGLDEIHLKDEGLFLAMDDDEIEMVDMGDHRENLSALRAEEILGNPVLEVLRLADVDYLVLGVFHLINARFVRKESDLAFELFAEFHPLISGGRWSLRPLLLRQSPLHTRR